MAVKPLTLPYRPRTPPPVLVYCDGRPALVDAVTGRCDRCGARHPVVIVAPAASVRRA